MGISEDLLQILACPICKGNLEYRKHESKLACKGCARLYVIRDDIPIMLVDEAEIDTGLLKTLHPQLPERSRSNLLPENKDTPFTATYFPWSLIANENTLKRALLYF